MSESQFRESFEVDDKSVLLALSGPQQSLLGEVSRQSGVEVSLRGNTIYLAGEEGEVRVAHRFLVDAAELVHRDHVDARAEGRRAQQDRLPALGLLAVEEQRVDHPAANAMSLTRSRRTSMRRVSMPPPWPA